MTPRVKRPSLVLIELGKCFWAQIEAEIEQNQRRSCILLYLYYKISCMLSKLEKNAKLYTKISNSGKKDNTISFWKIAKQLNRYKKLNFIFLLYSNNGKLNVKSHIS